MINKPNPETKYKAPQWHTYKLKNKNAITKNKYKIGQKINTTSSFYTIYIRLFAHTVCGRFGLWPFRFVTVPVCGRSGLWPFRFVAVSVCGLLGLWPFRFWPFRFVAVMTRNHPDHDTALTHSRQRDFIETDDHNKLSWSIATPERIEAE